MLSLNPTALAGLALGVASIAYLLLAIRGVGRFQGPRRSHAQEFSPPVTILKPLCGLEAGLYECLRSFCEQSYPHYQIVFGVSDPVDPALVIVDRLVREFPGRDIAVVTERARHGPNPKVSNLVNMMAAAKHPVLVVSDSDVRVERDCLSAIVAPLQGERVGAVTCLYKGAPAGRFASRFGALFINDWFIPSAVVDASMREIDFCFGPVSAVRRDALEAIGGFERLAQHLADDYLLGQLVCREGYRVVLSKHVVTTVVDEPDLRSLFSRELRWARTVRTCRARDHWLSVVTQALPLTALLLLVPRPSVAGGLVLATAIVLRLVLSRMVRQRFALERPAPLWLVPVRECLCFAVWMASLIGREVRWRGRRFAITAAGTLVERSAGAELWLRPTRALDDAYSQAQSSTVEFNRGNPFAEAPHRHRG